MRGKKSDFTGLANKLNEFKAVNEGKRFTYKDLTEKIQKLGFGSSICKSIPKLFPYEKSGRAHIYVVDSKEITPDTIKSIYKSHSGCKKDNDLGNSISKVKSAGLGVIKIIGFDTDKFAKDHPELYKQYLKYEIL